jgi:hypothetical protein
MESNEMNDFNDTILNNDTSSARNKTYFYPKFVSQLEFSLYK